MNIGVSTGQKREKEFAKKAKQQAKRARKLERRRGAEAAKPTDEIKAKGENNANNN